MTHSASSLPDSQALEQELINTKQQVDIYRQLKKSVGVSDLASYDKVKLYKQMCRQLNDNLSKYNKEGKADLARLILDSL